MMNFINEEGPKAGELNAVSESFLEEVEEE